MLVVLQGFPVCSPIWDLITLDRNSEALAMEMRDLWQQRKDVEQMATASRRLTDPVVAWLKDVEWVKQQVDALWVALDRRGTGCLVCSMDSFRLAREAAHNLRRVKELMAAEHELGALAGRYEDDCYPLVGRAVVLSAIRDALKREDVWAIGIFGMAGIGKTALLTKVNNELLVAGSCSQFDAVIWVAVSQEPDVHKIQQDIGDRLGLRLPESSADERVLKLRTALERRRFLLLLDDLWEALDLTAIGIPSDQRASKLLFTSRSSAVCSRMRARVKLRVGALSEEASWKLFRRNLDADADLMKDPEFERVEFKRLAKQMVDKCGGLPLALITARRTLPDVWRRYQWLDSYRLDALSWFTGSQGMERVLSRLSVTFDKLENDSHRECLLYCCLFPGDHNIHIEELVDYWVGEGLLDDPSRNDDIDVARRKGLAVINNLRGACLLERGDGEDGDMYVKMHDLIRDMALWRGGEKKRFSLVRGNSLGFLDEYQWKDAARISLMDSEIRDLPDSPRCPDLVTFLINQNTQLNRIPRNFFCFMPILRVLDLSSTSIEELPDQIGMLIKLRYLNLSRTFIRRFPENFGSLKELEQLDLGHTRELVSIHPTAITALTALQKLNLCNSAYCWTLESEDDGETRVTLQHLSRLNRLNDLRLDVEALPVLVKILGTDRLSSFVRHLTLQRMGQDLTQLPSNFHALSRLRELCIDACSSLHELTFSSAGELQCLEVLSLLDLSITRIVIQKSALPLLRDLRIFRCHALKDLTPVHQLPCLQCVDLRLCTRLEVLISARVDENFLIFPQLRKIYLDALPNFTGIYGRPLCLPCLEYLEVYDCPMLTKFPLDSDSARTIEQILSTRKWWDALEWDEESTKWRFLPYFRDLWQEEEEEEEEEEDSSSPMVGRGATLSAIRDHLKRDDVWVIGIFGMAGIGKTALLREVNNGLLVAGSSSQFDVVIWVAVSQEPDVYKIQQVIGDRLGLPLLEITVKKRALKLRTALERRRFLLLLDDLWEALDLTAIGIPSDQRASKLLFTSRSWAVCSQMHPDVTVRVDVLSEEASWKLFRRNLGADEDLMMDPVIKPLAKQIVVKCGGLPLALVTVGRALAGAREVDQWENTLARLTEPTGIESVLSRLSVTFDRLENYSHRKCLVYCCLFPGDHNIHIEELVDYWVGEGLLDDPSRNDDIDVARSRGLAVINKLKDACLLEKGGGEDGDMYVKMHDLIRDMALWRSGAAEFFLVSAGRGRSPNVPSDDRWSDAVRISLMDGEVRDLSKFPHCPNLVTLLLSKNTQLNCIPSNFFKSVPILRVLDLSSTSIEELPAEIGMLIKLRYLNLSRTLIRRFPENFGSLKELEQLDLGYTRELVSIPSTAITTLIGLQKLNLCNSAYSWAPESSEDDEDTRVTLKHLSLLHRLNDLRLDVESLPILEEILATHRLSRFVRHLTLQRMKPLTHLPTGFHSLSKLRELCIHGCPSLQELTFGGGELECLEVLSLLDLSKITTIVIQGSALPSLRDLHVFGCHELRDLTPVHQLLHLRCVDLRACRGLEVLISATVDENFPIFLLLRKINLYELPNFRAIIGHPLFLPCLEYLEVYECPMFRNLSLDSHSAISIKQILGMQQWWDSLQWDEVSTKWQFLPYFRDLWRQEEEESNRREQSGGGEASGGIHS